MNVKELMVGDWVSIITPELNYYTAHWSRGDYRLDTNYDKWLHPIPLTAEILEKNGFETYAMYHTLHDKQVRIEYYWHESRLEIQPYDGEPWIKLAPLRYVHELQHALRLCGLNELADNFKVD